MLGKGTTSDIKNVNFPTQFFLGGISNEFDATGSREVLLKGNVYEFQSITVAFDKSDIFNNHEYLIVKNNTK